MTPRAGAWWNFAFLILTGIAAGSLQLQGMPDAVVALSQTWAKNGAWIISVANAVFHLYSTDQAGPLVGTNPVRMLLGRK